MARNADQAFAGRDDMNDLVRGRSRGGSRRRSACGVPADT